MRFADLPPYSRGLTMSVRCTSAIWRSVDATSRHSASLILNGCMFVDQTTKPNLLQNPSDRKKTCATLFHCYPDNADFLRVPVNSIVETWTWSSSRDLVIGSVLHTSEGTFSFVLFSKQHDSNWLDNWLAFVNEHVLAVFCDRMPMEHEIFFFNNALTEHSTKTFLAKTHGWNFVQEKGSSGLQKVPFAFTYSTDRKRNWVSPFRKILFTKCIVCFCFQLCNDMFTPIFTKGRCLHQSYIGKKREVYAPSFTECCIHPFPWKDCPSWWQSRREGHPCHC